MRGRFPNISDEQNRYSLCAAKTDILKSNQFIVIMQGGGRVGGRRRPANTRKFMGGCGERRLGTDEKYK